MCSSIAFVFNGQHGHMTRETSIFRAEFNEKCVFNLNYTLSKLSKTTSLHSKWCLPNFSLPVLHPAGSYFYLDHL